MRFFRTTWIPDETFFQTLVRHLIPREQIRSRTLTFLMFTDYGMPVTFHNDHYDLLLGQDALFARKISPEATELKARLGEVYASTAREFPVSGEGRALYRFLTGQGREGLRFAPRIWEAEAHLERHHRLLVIVCKKWHVGKRLADRIRAEAGLPAVDYLFNDEGAALPDLGGLESRLDKRTRHRRALIRLLFEVNGGDRLAICVDPASRDLIEDFDADRGDTRVLEVACDMGDAWLRGHARRIGLTGDATPEAAAAEVLPPLRRSLEQESARLAERFGGLRRLRQGAPAEENAMSLAGFLDIPLETAQRIAGAPDLFDD
jgi:hypothetical protein